MSKAYFQAVQGRRTVYNLTAESTLSNDRLLELVQTAVKHTPTPYNIQSSRAVLVIGDKHRELWTKLLENMSPAIKAKPEIVAMFTARMKWFGAAYGFIATFEDNAVIDQAKLTHAMAAPLMPTFALNSTGMLQHMLWTALAAEGMGASLQHVAQQSPDNAALVHSLLGTPSSWMCTAIMPFGVAASAPDEKTFKDITERVKLIV